MIDGLVALDAAMGEKPMVYAFSPITMVSPGGFLAVAYFGNRNSTEDIDVIIEPDYASDKEIAKEIRDAMAEVGVKLKIGEDWINDHVALFLNGDSRRSIFEEAARQNIVLWEGEYLRVLAAPLEWGLETKLRRLTTKPHHPKAETDVADILEILNRLTDQNNGPLKRRVVQELNRNGFDVAIHDQAINRVAAAYRTRYGKEPFC